MIADDEIGALLRTATDDIDVALPPADALVGAGRARLRRRRIIGAVATLTAVAIVGIGIPVALGSHSTRTGTGATGATTSPAGCVTRVPSRVLPTWARDGFSEAKPRMPYVLGDSGNIAAILFADPLLYPPPNNPANKVLWVSRVSYGWGAPLHITATLADGSMTAHRVVEGGPGPSYLNLPAVGMLGPDPALGPPHRQPPSGRRRSRFREALTLDLGARTFPKGARRRDRGGWR